jgi:hypothetical protein
MSKAILAFLTAILTNRSKDLFVARLGAKLFLARFGIVGVWADLLSWPIRSLLGALIDQGIYAIDLTLDSIKAAMSIPEFRKAALIEYKKAKRKDLTENEKAQIRKEYLDTLDRFTRLRM